MVLVLLPVNDVIAEGNNSELMAMYGTRWYNFNWSEFGLRGHQSACWKSIESRMLNLYYSCSTTRERVERQILNCLREGRYLLVLVLIIFFTTSTSTNVADVLPLRKCEVFLGVLVQYSTYINLILPSCCLLHHSS